MRGMTYLFLFLLVAIPCTSATITVNWDGTGDYTTIQAGIDAAVSGADTVVVADGTYTGSGNRDIDFLGKAITVRSKNPEDPNIVAATVINSEGGWIDGHRGFIFWNGEAENSVLDGFSIINGLAWNEDGGGILCNGSSPTIRNCIIKNNSAELHMIGGGHGGGIALINSGAKIFNCAITSNSADFYGGGIYSEVSDYATINNCTISGNSGNGGLYNLGIDDGPVVTNSIIWGNSSGAIVNDESGFGSVIATYTDVQGVISRHRQHQCKSIIRGRADG